MARPMKEIMQQGILLTPEQNEAQDHSEHLDHGPASPQPQAAPPAPKPTIRAILEKPEYQDAFQKVLGDKAPAFIASICAIANMPGIKECDAKSIIGAAYVAAALDLPIHPALGFAYIVPYRHKTGVRAQFQLGYKSYIQLALRSQQYARLGVFPVNAEAFKGYDEFGDPIIDASALDFSKPAIGYMARLKLINGFEKAEFWPIDAIKRHAQRYSQSYRSGREESPWHSNFEQMAKKTVLAHLLRKWGFLSPELLTATRYDQALIEEPEGEPQYVDNDSEDQRSSSGLMEMISAAIEE